MHFGHVPNSSLARAVAACRPHLPSGSTLVIRAIDSERSAHGLAYRLSGEIPFRVEHGNVCCALDDVSDEWLETLDGFEEMWIFDAAGPDRTLDRLPALTSDLGPLDGERGASIASTVLETGCRIALGDGCGLNYVVRDALDEERIRAPD